MISPPASDAPSFGPADRRAVAAVAVQFFVNGFVFASFIPRLPEIRDRLGVSLDTIGLLITVSLGIGLLGSVIASPLIDRFGSRRVLIICVALLVGALPLIGVATAPAVFVAGLATMAVFDVVVDVAMNLQGSWLSARRHAPVMNRLHGLWSLGTVVGGVVAWRVAAAGVGLPAHLIAASVVSFGALVFVGTGLLREDEHPASGDAAPDVGGAPAAMRRGLVLLAAAGAIAITVEIVSSDWAAFRLSEDFDAAPSFAGLGYVAFVVGMTLGRLGGDWVVVRLGSDRLLRAAIVVSIVGLAGAGLAPNRWIVLVSYVIAGLGIATFFPKLYDDAAQFRGKRGLGLAWLTGGSRFIGFLIPGVVGLLAASRLSVGAAISIVTLPCAIAFLVLSTRQASRPQPVVRT